MLFRIFVFIFLFVACLPQAEKKALIVKKVEKDGLVLTLTRPVKFISTVELLSVELTAQAPQGSEFIFPDKHANFGDFSYFESHETSLKLNSQNNVSRSLSLVLEPGLAGVHKFPALNVLYGDKQIQTEPFVVEVTSVLGEEDKEVRDIAQLSSETQFSSLFLAFIPVLYLIYLFLKKDNFFDERRDFFENLFKKMSEADFAELPKVFCEFLSENYCDKTVYTGSDGIEKYLKLIDIEAELKDEIVSTFKDYEKQRFSEEESTPSESLNKRFVELARKLEVKG